MDLVSTGDRGEITRLSVCSHNFGQWQFHRIVLQVCGLPSHFFQPGLAKNLSHDLLGGAAEHQNCTEPLDGLPESHRADGLRCVHDWRNDVWGEVDSTQSQGQSSVTAFLSGSSGITPAYANCLAIGSHTHQSTDTTTATTGSGYTAVICTEDNSASQSHASEWQVLSGAPATQAKFTVNSSDTGVTALALFRPNGPALLGTRFANGSGSLASYTPTAGSLLIVTAWSSSGPTISGGSLTWHQIASVSLGGGSSSPFVTMWYAENVPNSAVSVTIGTATTIAFATLSEYSGMATSGSLDTSASLASQSTSSTGAQTFHSGSVNPSNGADLIYAALNLFNSNATPAVSNGTGFVGAGSDGGSSGEKQEFQVPGSTSAVNPSFSASPSSGTTQWSGITAAFFVSGAGGPSNHNALMLLGVGT